MINVKQLILPEVKLLMPQLHHDDRGYVTEIAHGRQLQEVGLPGEFVQENQSMSRFKNSSIARVPKKHSFMFGK